MKLKYFPLLILLAFVINACGSQKRKTVKRSIKTTKTVAKAKKTPAKPEQQPHQKPQPPVKKEDALRVQLPEVKREFRAAWVASVANINWPLKVIQEHGLGDSLLRTAKIGRASCRERV